PCPYSLPRRQPPRGMAPPRIFLDHRSRLELNEAQRSSPGEKGVWPGSDESTAVLQGQLERASKGDAEASLGGRSTSPSQRCRTPARGSHYRQWFATQGAVRAWAAGRNELGLLP